MPVFQPFINVLLNDFYNKSRNIFDKYSIHIKLDHNIHTYSLSTQSYRAYLAPEDETQQKSDSQLGVAEEYYIQEIRIRR